MRSSTSNSSRASQASRISANRTSKTEVDQTLSRKRSPASLSFDRTSSNNVIDELASTVSSGLSVDPTSSRYRSAMVRRQELVKGTLDVYSRIRDAMCSSEDTQAMMKRLEIAPDKHLRRTYVAGHPTEQVNLADPVLKVGLCFLRGSDNPTANRSEFTTMAGIDAPDQGFADWRVNTCHLLSNFVLTNDLYISKTDRTPEIRFEALDRLGRSNARISADSNFTIKSAAVTQPFQGVTIDSNEVLIVDDLQKHRGKFDLESTLVEVDGSSLMSLIVRYRLLIQRNPGTDWGTTETVDILEQMLEDIHRLC